MGNNDPFGVNNFDNNMSKITFSAASKMERDRLKQRQMNEQKKNANNDPFSSFGNNNDPFFGGNNNNNGFSNNGFGNNNNNGIGNNNGFDNNDPFAAMGF